MDTGRCPGRSLSLYEDWQLDIHAAVCYSGAHHLSPHVKLSCSCRPGPDSALPLSADLFGPWRGGGGAGDFSSSSAGNKPSSHQQAQRPARPAQRWGRPTDLETVRCILASIPDDTPWPSIPHSYELPPGLAIGLFHLHHKTLHGSPGPWQACKPPQVRDRSWQHDRHKPARPKP